MSHTQTYMAETAAIAGQLNAELIERMAVELIQLRERGGRLFLAGLGGSAANASHAVNDFRKLCGIESYCLSDNVSELTARANDDGWARIYGDLLKSSHTLSKDALLVLSVGGGTSEVSLPLVYAINYATGHEMSILGIIGRDGGYTKPHAKCCVIIPTVNQDRVTPHTEAFQMVVLHCLVSHPKLQLSKTKW